MSDARRNKHLLFQAISVMGKAFASPVRLELLDLLAQAPRTVEALARATARLTTEVPRLSALRDRLENAILTTIPGSSRNGAKEPRLPNTSSITLDSLEAEAVLMLLDQVGICASSGSACTTGSLDPSHVLVAMGLSPARARGSSPPFNNTRRGRARGRRSR